jgi:hypothetical protein
VQNGKAFAPTVFQLVPEALDDLWTFIQHKVLFDMDAILFEDFNEAFRRRHCPATDNASNYAIKVTSVKILVSSFTSGASAPYFGR